MGSGEDIYLMVHNVRHKKHDGTLYLMSRHLGWMPHGKDTFTISHSYADIKSQKISPADRIAKVQLQVLLHSNVEGSAATTFHFVNPLGPEAQLQDRDSVKDLLLQLLPKFKRKLDKDLEEKNRILQEDPDLFQLYRDLVVEHVITAEEFWATHLKKSTGDDQAQQDVGVSAAFLTEVKIQPDSSNGLRYNLSADVVQAIFRTYPAVRKKHREEVPHNLTENEFWTRFFQSHYFHRDRTSFSSKDIFSECVKLDEQDFTEALNKSRCDPNFVDLAGLEDDPTHGLSKEPSASSEPQSLSVNRSLIRRFNHHSMMILQATDQQQLAENDTSSEPPKKLRVMETEEKELEEEPEGQEVGVPCQTSRDPYQHTLKLEYTSPDTLMTCDEYLLKEVKEWHPSSCPELLSEKAARKALADLGSQGIIMARPNSFSKEGVPTEVCLEITRVYLSLQELLRHFWACFPANTPTLQDKLINMKNSLDKFYYSKILPLNNLLNKHHCNQELMEHLRTMAQAAFNKFAAWNAKRNSQRTL